MRACSVEPRAGLLQSSVVLIVFSTKLMIHQSLQAITSLELILNMKKWNRSRYGRSNLTKCRRNGITIRRRRRTAWGLGLGIRSDRAQGHWCGKTALIHMETLVELLWKLPQVSGSCLRLDVRISAWHYRVWRASTQRLCHKTLSVLILLSNQFDRQRVLLLVIKRVLFYNHSDYHFWKTCLRLK